MRLWTCPGQKQAQNPGEILSQRNNWRLRELGPSISLAAGEGRPLRTFLCDKIAPGFWAWSEATDYHRYSHLEVMVLVSLIVYSGNVLCTDSTQEPTHLHSLAPTHLIWLITNSQTSVCVMRGYRNSSRRGSIPPKQEL